MKSENETPLASWESLLDQTYGESGTESRKAFEAESRAFRLQAIIDAYVEGDYTFTDLQRELDAFYGARIKRNRTVSLMAIISAVLPPKGRGNSAMGLSA